MNNNEYSFELRIEGPTLETTEISNILRLSPTYVREKRPRFKVAVWGYDGTDHFDEPVYWPSFEEGFVFLLDKLASRLPEIRALRERYDVRFWCGHFQFGPDGGPTFSPSLLDRLSAVGVELFIDTHFVRPPER